MTTMWPTGTARHIVRHPQDLIPLLRSAWRMRRRSWWRTAPFLPVPDQNYWAFRVATAYGDASSPISIEDAVAAARWSLRHRPGR
jgi:hypothetical protein